MQENKKKFTLNFLGAQTIQLSKWTNEIYLIGRTEIVNEDLQKQQNKTMTARPSSIYDKILVKVSLTIIPLPRFISPKYKLLDDHGRARKKSIK